MTTVDMNLLPKTDWVQVFPFAVVMGANSVRPVIVFKDKLEQRVLPVWLTPVDAGIVMAQSSFNLNARRADTSGSPHETVWILLNELGVTLEKCLFKMVTKNQQYLELHFVSGKKLSVKKKVAKSASKDISVDLKTTKLSKKQKKEVKKIIEVKAEDAISFCLRSGCKFFATIDYIEKSRVLEMEIASAPLVGNQVEQRPRYLN